MIGKGAFIIAGSVFILSGLFLSLLVVAMSQHPGGIGAEKLLGPLLGLIAFGLFLAGGSCLYAAGRVGKGRTGQRL